MELIWTVGLEDSEVGPAELGAIVKALVMYEDPVVGNRALAMLNSVARGVDTPGRLVCGLWRFHFLSEPSFLKSAVAEAAAADIILIAVRNGQELPAAVNQWINIWLSISTTPPKALVVLADGEAGGECASSAVFSRLREVARIGGMDFFASGGGKAAGTTLQTVLTRALAQHDQEPASSAGAEHSQPSRQ